MSWQERVTGWFFPPEEALALPVPLRPGSTAVEDRQLAEWVRPQPEPLLPVLRQASFMRPLVLLLAVLPPLIAFQYRPLSLAGAEWSLRALDSYAAGTVAGVLDPVADAERVESHGRPAAISWVTAAGMAIAGPERNGSRAVVTLLSTMGLIVACSLLANRYRTDRLGLIAAGLVAVQATVLGFAQQPEPDGLALLCLTAALWSWQKHLAVSGRWLTPWLPLAIISLAGVFLAGGALGVVSLVAMLGLLVLHRRLADPDSARSLWDAVLLAATALPLGLWWILWIFFRHGPSTMLTWWTLGPAPPEWIVHTPGDAILAFVHSTGPWVSLAVAGAWSIAAERSAGGDGLAASRRLGGVGLLLLAALALGGWAVLVLAVPSQVGRPWISAASLSVWLLAAAGILSIAERRLSFPVSVAVLLISLVEFAWHWLNSTTLQVSPLGVWLVVGGLAVCLVSLAWMAGMHEIRRRAILLGLLVFCGLGSAWLSAAQMHRATPEDRQLQSIRLSYIALPKARSCCLMIGEAAKGNPHDAMRRRYLIRSIWPALSIQECDDSKPPVLPETEPTEDDGADIVILWGTRQHVPGTDFKLAHSHDDRGFEVATYVRQAAVPIADEPRGDF